MSLIKRYMKRFMPVLCVMSLLISCLVFPSYAAQIETENDTGLLHYDLLQATEYAFILDNREIMEVTPVHYFERSNNIDFVSIKWDSGHNRNFSKVIVALNSTVQPLSVRFENQEIKYLNKINYSRVGDVYFYEYSNPTPFSISLELDVEFSDVYSGFFGIYSVVGLLDAAQSINSVNVTRYDEFHGAEGFWNDQNLTGNKSLPYVFDTDFEVYDGAYYGSTFDFVIDGDSFVSPLVTDFSCLFSTPSNDVYARISLISKDSSIKNVENIKFNLNETIQYGMSADEYLAPGEFEWINSVQLTADLSGFDMSKYDILIWFQIEPVKMEYQGLNAYASLTFHSVSYVPFIENTPWYKTFFGSLFGGISSRLSTIYETIANFWDSVTGNFTHLFEKLEQYFGNDGELAQAGDQMSQQADQMQQANDSLNALDKPQLQPDSLFDSFLNFDTGGLVILSAFTSNAYITQLLVVVFTFALGAFVFFGKRR